MLSLFVRVISAIPLLFSFLTPSHAFTFSSGQTVTCRSVNGQAVPEVGVPNMSGIFHAGYTGVTVVAPNGSAQISWDLQKLASLPPAVHDFIYFHECAHAHVPTSDELVANCIGLVDMRAAGLANPAIEAQIGAYHSALGYMGPQYGVGATYWAETLQCANRTAPNSQSSLATSNNASGTTTTCQFTSGPLSGQVIDFHGRAGVTPAAVGSPCTDGVGSVGVAVPASGTVTTPSGGTTTSCHFQSGPRMGQTIDYASQPGIIPISVGMPCQDGAGSFGVSVPMAGAPASNSSQLSAIGMSSKCKFSFGPRAGQTQDYSPLPPAPIGTPCNDGLSSVGSVIP